MSDEIKDDPTAAFEFSDKPPQVANTADVERQADELWQVERNTEQFRDELADTTKFYNDAFAYMAVRMSAREQAELELSGSGEKEEKRKRKLMRRRQEPEKKDTIHRRTEKLMDEQGHEIPVTMVWDTESGVPVPVSYEQPLDPDSQQGPHLKIDFDNGAMASIEIRDFQRPLPGELVQHLGIPTEEDAQLNRIAFWQKLAHPTLLVDTTEGSYHYTFDPSPRHNTLRKGKSGVVTGNAPSDDWYTNTPWGRTNYVEAMDKTLQMTPIKK